MFYKALNLFYPGLSRQEARKFALLGVSLLLIVGVYWLTRLLKNVVFYKMAFPVELGWDAGCGRLMQPIAKFWSPFVVIGVIFVYSKLIDLYKKQSLFYIIAGFYSVVFATLGLILGIKALYGPTAVGCRLLATTGWVGYFASESFGSLIIALFWSFTASICTTEEAKKGYPVIVTAAQVGAILGSFFPLLAGSVGGVWPIFLLASVATLCIIPLIYFFMKTTPPELLVGNPEAAKTIKEKEGFIEGFLAGVRLLFTRSYLVGILLVSTLYEIATAIVEYQMQVQADMSPAFAGEIGFTWFESMYGIATNGLSFLIALLGTSYILKRFGLRISLMIYPVCFLIALVSLFIFFFYGNPSASALLWATTAVMVVIKGLNYAVNNPTKEMMYIPTSKDVKFKSKGWIDMFGNRTAKMGGAQVSNLFKYNFSDLMLYGTLFSLGLIGIWMAAAFYVGKKNAQLVHDGEIVE